MLRAAIAFFVLGILSMFLGMNNIAGLSIEIGKIMLFVFLAFAVISFIGSMLRGQRTKLLSGLLLLGVVSSNVALAETATETAKELANDTKRGALKAGRAVKETACPLINGKIVCATQKAKHSAQNVSDKVEDAID